METKASLRNVPREVLDMVDEAEGDGQRVLPVVRRQRVVAVAVHVDRRQTVLAARLERCGFVRRPPSHGGASGAWWIWRRREA